MPPRAASSPSSQRAPAGNRRASADSAAVRVLRGAARGLLAHAGGFQAGELWLLDDSERGPAGSTLRLAARWADAESGLAAEVPAPGERLLADAPADVAALAGGAVTLEDRDALAEWQPFATGVSAGLCLPVSGPDTIHGVVWFLADHAMAMPDEAVELAEIVAARIALELERQPTASTHARASEHALSRDTNEASGDRGALPARVRDATDEPATPALTLAASVTPVEAAGWTHPQSGGPALAACASLADGRLLSLAAAAIDSPDSNAASQQSTLDWLRGEALGVASVADDAGELLTRLNRRLIESPHAGEGLALAAALIDPPEDADEGLGGAGSYAVAGPTIALTIRAASTDAHTGDLVPLGWCEPEASYAPRPFTLPVRGRLVLVAGDPRLTSPLLERRLADAYRSVTADAHRDMHAKACLRRLGQAGVDEAWAAIALRRG